MNDQRRQKRLFDVVDLDPYGTAVPFLESSIGAMANGGLMCVTFTDMAVLCARKPHVCFYKYGSAPLPKKYCHEMALRIALYTISTMANKHGKYIEPLLSLTVDFYIRLFIRVKDGAAQCHHSITKYSHVMQCVSCDTHYFQPYGVHTIESTDELEKKKRKKWKGTKNPNKVNEEEEDKNQQEEESKGKQIKKFSVARC